MRRGIEALLRARVRVIREPAFVPMTARRREVCWDYGVPAREEPFCVVEDLRVELRPGSILLLTGPSGSGKSSILGAVAEQAGRDRWVGRGRFADDRAIVDAVAPRKDLRTALEILTACGLGEPRLWLRRYCDLSDGEKFRAALARAVGDAVSSKEPVPIFCDEFTAILHRRLAKAIAYNLRKLVTRARLILVVAAAHEDIIDDLQPDRVVRLCGLTPTVHDIEAKDRAMSLQRRLVVEQGSVSDYRLFAPMHYRHRDGLGFVDKVFLLRERPSTQPLGILVFAHAPLELTMRNRSTCGRFVRNGRRLNRELRILRRLVMHPDIRGCGIGHWFVRETLPRVGVRFVECLAAMGAVNPVFEKAGMSRIGRCPLPRGRLALLERIRQWKLDPFGDDFGRHISRCPRVRTLVEKTVQDWVNIAHGAASQRIRGRPGGELARSFRQLIGEPPIYYLWDRERVFPKMERIEATDRADPSARPVRARPRSGDRHDPR
ncbi:MAG: AAA family ATPase [Planctomycetota bacterium]|mgnify:CR=1 FL=1